MENVAALRPLSPDVAAPAVAGWHGLHPATLEIDYALLLELTPDATAIKILVDDGSPAKAAGLHTGDYIVAARSSQLGALPVAECIRRALPVGDELVVQIYRPGWPRRILRTMVVRVRAARRAAKPLVRAPFGPEVQPKDRLKFLAGVMGVPGIKPEGSAILQRMLAHYDGPRGIFPSVGTIARDIGLEVRATQNHLRRLEQLGVLEVRRNAGARTGSGWTNRYVVHWPDGVSDDSPAWDQVQGVHDGAPQGCMATTPRGAPPCTQTLPLTPRLNPAHAASIEERQGRLKFGPEGLIRPTGRR